MKKFDKKTGGRRATTAGNKAITTSNKKTAISNKAIINSKKAITTSNKNTQKVRATIATLLKKAIDVTMFLLWTYLIRYKHLGSLLYHAMAGAALLLLFIIHNIINIKWWAAIFKGSYSIRRAIMLVVNLTLATCFLGMAGSSVFMSAAVIEWNPLPLTYRAMLLHKWSAKVGYAAMIVHVLLHIRLKSIITKGEKIIKIRGKKLF